MRARNLLLPSALLSLGLCLSSFGAHAQTPPPAEAPQGIEADRNNQLIERIQHEDAGSRIEELRVGGETRSINVQPKNGGAGYEVAPVSGGENVGSGSATNAGRSRWRIMSF
ncbi:hypothetical protein [Hydrogenophaga sp. NFH-34]|uniref:hypothetical protein n=1 Tax=Hydrogenophaga sp. NFH-34 TaxID=2744446 RepID=UPI001F3534B1|nr:hypothetical protein [Hydrogenophaga sp. NFH-34]